MGFRIPLISCLTRDYPILTTGCGKGLIKLYIKNIIGFKKNQEADTMLSSGRLALSH
jgi:hypothetical protein